MACLYAMCIHQTCKFMKSCLLFLFLFDRFKVKVIEFLVAQVALAEFTLELG